jgi:hypothetical protein
MKDQQKSLLNKRSLNVMVMFFSFALLPPSGIMLHFTDHLATNDLLRHFVMSIHNFSSIIFLVSGVLHIITNWKAMKRHMSSKVGEYVSFKREMVIAFVIVIGIIAFLSSHVFHLN